MQLVTLIVEAVMVATGDLLREKGIRVTGQLCDQLLPIVRREALVAVNTILADGREFLSAGGGAPKTLCVVESVAAARRIVAQL